MGLERLRPAPAGSPLPKPPNAPLLTISDEQSMREVKFSSSSSAIGLKDRKRMKNLTIMAAMALLAACLLPATASAQSSCPPGTTNSPAGPGGPVPCIPISDTSPYPPEYVWINGWAAYANSDENMVGMSSDMSSRGKAKKAAIEDCTKKGGTNCEVRLVYRHQCAIAFAGKASDGMFETLFQSAATIEQATGLAMSWCNEKSLSECQVYFKNCSYSEQAER